MRIMKVKFSVDIKNPGKRSCYTKITNIKLFDSENFQIWMNKNFENFIKENKDNFTNESIVEIEYTDLDSNDIYKYIANFKNNLYEFYMNNEKLETMSITELFNFIFNGLNTFNESLDEECAENKEECTNNEPLPEPIYSGQCEPIMRLKDAVMNEFDNRYISNDDIYIKMLKDAILYKISNKDFSFIGNLSPLIEYNRALHKKPIGIVIDISSIDFGDANFNIIEPIKEYLNEEGFADAMFNLTRDKLVCVF